MRVVNSSTVSLVDTMGSDLSPVNAARVSYGKRSNALNEKDIQLLDYLARHQHISPFQHTCLQFHIQAPIFVARQLVKHQVGLSWNEISRRYVTSDIVLYMPNEWRKKADDKKQGSSTETINLMVEGYGLDNKYNIKEDLMVCLDNLLSMYNLLLDKGVCPEQARMILPQNLMTEWYWTGSLAAFFRVFKLRTHPNAQKETQEVAIQIGNYCSSEFPNAWRKLLDYN